MMYSRNLFVLDFTRRFFVRCVQIFEAYAVRTLIKFERVWRKIGRKSKCRKDSERTLCTPGISFQEYITLKAAQAGLTGNPVRSVRAAFNLLSCTLANSGITKFREHILFFYRTDYHTCYKVFLQERINHQKRNG